MLQGAAHDLELARRAEPAGLAERVGPVGRAAVAAEQLLASLLCLGELVEWVEVGALVLGMGGGRSPSVVDPVGRQSVDIAKVDMESCL